MATVGYVRKCEFDSTGDQQLAGVITDREYVDVASAKEAERPSWDDCLTSLQAGDSLVIESMDRAFRSIKSASDTLEELSQRGVWVRFVNPPASTRDPNFLRDLQILAEFEKSLQLERQREGIEAAKQRGAYKGRKMKLSPEQVERLRSRLRAGDSPAELALDFGISRGAVYVYKKRFEEGL